LISKDCTVKLTCGKNRRIIKRKLKKCGKNAKCRGYRTSRKCRCIKGYYGNGFVCKKMKKNVLRGRGRGIRIVRRKKGKKIVRRRRGRKVVIKRKKVKRS